MHTFSIDILTVCSICILCCICIQIIGMCHVHQEEMKASTLSNVVGWIGDLLAGLLENISICKQTGILSQWTSASDNPSVGGSSEPQFYTSTVSFVVCPCVLAGFLEQRN